MPGKTYRVGIVGVGLIADFHARALAELPNAELAAGSCRTAAKGEAFAGKFSCDYEPNYESLCNRDDIDVVSICTPSGAHAEPAIAAARGGKHVICEKPLDISLARVDEMIGAAEAAGVKLGGIFPCRFEPVIGQLRHAMQAGRFGRLSFVGGFVPWWRTQEYYDQGGWKGTQSLDGGGAVMNQSVHVVDLLQYLGGPVKRVQAVTARLAHPQIEVEDTAVVTLEFANGALGSLIAATSMYPGRLRRLEISGDSGTAVVVESNLEFWQFADELPEDAEIRQRYSSVTDTGGGAADPAAISHEGHQRNFEAFFRALDAGIEPELNGREARKAVELTLAIYRSAQSSGPVELPLLDEHPATC